jgi:hypothetical protein
MWSINIGMLHKARGSAKVGLPINTQKHHNSKNRAFAPSVNNKYKYHHFQFGSSRADDPETLTKQFNS